jgi:hypothetical protein
MEPIRREVSTCAARILCSGQGLPCFSRFEAAFSSSHSKSPSMMVATASTSMVCIPYPVKRRAPRPRQKLLRFVTTNRGSPPRARAGSPLTRSRGVPPPRAAGGSPPRGSTTGWRHLLIGLDAHPLPFPHWAPKDRVGAARLRQRLPPSHRAMTSPAPSSPHLRKPAAPSAAGRRPAVGFADAPGLDATSRRRPYSSRVRRPGSR